MICPFKTGEHIQVTSRDVVMTQPRDPYLLKLGQLIWATSIDRAETYRDLRNADPVKKILE